MRGPGAGAPNRVGAFSADPAAGPSARVPRWRVASRRHALGTSPYFRGTGGADSARARPTRRTARSSGSHGMPAAGPGRGRAGGAGPRRIGTGEVRSWRTRAGVGPAARSAPAPGERRASARRRRTASPPHPFGAAGASRSAATVSGMHARGLTGGPCSRMFSMAGPRKDARPRSPPRPHHGPGRDPFRVTPRGAVVASDERSAWRLRAGRGRHAGDDPGADARP